MISRIFLGLTRGSGTRRRWLFRTLFELIARLSGNQEHWTFMNYGFAGAAGSGADIDLTPEEEAQRVCCQLYDVVASAVAIAGKDVVEVTLDAKLAVAARLVDGAAPVGGLRCRLRDPSNDLGVTAVLTTSASGRWFFALYK